MRLIIEPEAGLAPILTAIKQAKKHIDVLIFRLDRVELARALQAAVARGVTVRALTAHTNRGGGKSLRKVELQLLEEGVAVSRTADDLLRYHGKMMIVDERVLHVYGFNFTAIDFEKSRSFGVVTRNGKLVREAIKLFEADFTRQPYMPAHPRLIVSPENARDRLTTFIHGARRQLLIYDPKVSDEAILRELADRVRAGVEVKIIGKVEVKGEFKTEKYVGHRLHIRAIIRDGQRAFLGSQSLRRVELEKRREIGLIIDEEQVVRQMQAVFEQDWALTPTARKEAKKAGKVERKEDRARLAAVS